MSGLFNYQEANVDWILSAIKELYDKTQNEFTGLLDDYMQKYFNSFFADAVYSEENESITLTKGDSPAESSGKNVSQFNVGDLLGIAVKDAIARNSAEKAKSDITQVRGIINMLTKTNIDTTNLIIFGDSFTQGYSPDGNTSSWAHKLVDMLDTTQSDVYGEGGIGCVHTSGSTSRNALQAWNNHIASVPWRADATCVIIMLGWNDTGEEYTDVTSAVTTFFNKIRQDCPDAKIVYLFNPGITVSDRHVVRAYYRVARQLPNIVAVDSYWWMLLDSNNFASDHVHPVQNGQDLIAKNVFNALNGLRPTHTYEYDLDLSTGTSAQLRINNDKVTIYFACNMTASRANSVATFKPWMFPSNGFGGPNFKNDDFVGLSGSGTTIAGQVTASFGSETYGASIYFIHAGNDLTTGTARFIKTFDALAFFG